MTQFEPSSIGQWAIRQLADYDAHNPGTLFADGVVLNEADGYALQSAVTELRLRRGERVIGYKVGCTSPKIRAALGIDHCVSGRLFHSEQHSSGAVLRRADYKHLAVEGELAVELSREPGDSDFVETVIPACVARVIPVIELHNHILLGALPSAGELIANNALHAGFVAGSGIRPADTRGEPSLAIHADDQLLDECRGAVLIETINSSLKWLTEMLRSRGDSLCAGQIVLTGSIPSLFPIHDGCRISVEAPPFGSVDAQFI